MVWKKYTTKDNIIFYGKRFLKTFVPALLIVIPTMGFSPESFAVTVLVPALSTFDKWMRNNDWYKI